MRMMYHVYEATPYGGLVRIEHIDYDKEPDFSQSSDTYCNDRKSAILAALGVLSQAEDMIAQRRKALQTELANELYLTR